MMGDYLGVYAIGSGATGNAGTDYSDPQQQASMLESVRQMVEMYKNETYILFWVFGNENNFGVADNAPKKPAAYYQIVHKTAELIKHLDPDHPVALCNGDLGSLDMIGRYCRDVDILGVNGYRGDFGFGDSFWRDILETFGKPVVLTEFGCPAYSMYASQDAGE